MTRQEFISRLRIGLAGLPDAVRGEIVADYETHFTEGVAAGRSEADLAAALGDPGRLARELRAEAGLKRWETQRNPESAAAAVFAVLGLGAIDVLVLLPLLVFVVMVVLAMAIGAIVGIIGGAVMFAAGPFTHQGPGGPAATMLFGLGLMSFSVANLSIQILISTGLVNALVWYGRLHFRLLKPAMDPAPSTSLEPVAP